MQVLEWTDAGVDAEAVEVLIDLARMQSVLAVEGEEEEGAELPQTSLRLVSESKLVLY